MGIETEEEKASKASGGGGSSGGTISFMQAVRIPNVMGYAIAFGFFKFVNYAMFFWLPFFLALHFDPQAANVISTLYSVGMMPGGVIVGWVSDLLGGRRACVIAVFMTLLAPLLWIFAMFSDTMPPILLLVLLCIMGILVGGPNNIITSAVAADLAEDPSIGGNTRSLGTVTGIINGTGSITAAFGLMVIGPLQGLGGWTAVWYFLIACVVVGTLLMGAQDHQGDHRPQVKRKIDEHSRDNFLGVGVTHCRFKRGSSVRARGRHTWWKEETGYGGLTDETTSVGHFLWVLRARGEMLSLEGGRLAHTQRTT